MEKCELHNFKEILNKLKSEISVPSNVILTTEKVADEIDAAAVDIEAALATKLLSRKNAYLKRIEYALDKIEKNTYGECESCGDDISIKRLLVRPMALLCITCKEDQEKVEQKEKSFMKRGFLDDLE